jgi:hypothetical protein
VKIKNLLIIILFIFSSVTTTTAYDTDNVHPLINENALFQSNVDSYLKNQLGFTKGVTELFKQKEVKEWIKEGAKLEDETHCRSRNHFHDPLKSWDSAGLNNSVLNTICYTYYGESFSVDSSIIWSQKPTENLYSWIKAREYYYTALTNNDKNFREDYLAKTFRSVGQVMHLIADSSVPEHVRNDVHMIQRQEVIA